MGKTKTYDHAKYGRKYKSDWESENWARGWLTAAESSSINEARCKVCKTTLRAHRTDLKRHAQTKIHVDSMKKLQPLQNRQTLLSTCGVVNVKFEDKEKDLKLAAYIAAHSSIRSVDHLCELLVSIGKGTSFENLKLHRTKCSNLIKHVIAPCMLKELIMDIGTMKYSLIVDESTDVAIMKYLCLCVRYFSVQNRTIKTNFLGIISVENTTADSLFKYVHDYLLEIGLSISNLVGLGTDGGSNLCGKRHSLFTLLKERIPDLQLIRCICHSLDNAASKASEELPTNIDFLCKEVYSWFSCSAQRRSDYRNIFDLLNGHKKTFHQFPQLSTTRWLARYNVVNSLLEHWLELKTHFDLVTLKEKCYKARLLKEMLFDDSNYLYLKIIKPVLYEVNNLNLTFQKNQVDIGKAYDDLCNLIITLARKIIKPTFIEMGINVMIDSLENELAYLSVDKADYGIEYYQAVSSINLPIDKNDLIKIRAYTFIKKLIFQLAQRLPNSLNHFRNLKVFSPSICLSQIRPNFRDLPFINQFVKTDLALLEMQWQKLLNVEWSVTYGPEIIKNSVQFWSTVFTVQDAGGTFMFKDLAVFVLTLLSLPSSNAFVERAFSVMNAVKTKARNRLQFKMLESILRIRFHFYSNNICCKNFIISNDMYHKFNSSVVYNNLNSDSEDFSVIELCAEIETNAVSLSEL